MGGAHDLAFKSGGLAPMEQAALCIFIDDLDRTAKLIAGRLAGFADGFDRSLHERCPPGIDRAAAQTDSVGLEGGFRPRHRLLSGEFSNLNFQTSNSLDENHCLSIAL